MLRIDDREIVGNTVANVRDIHCHPERSVLLARVGPPIGRGSPDWTFAVQPSEEQRYKQRDDCGDDRDGD